jgi:hypothetical protein
VFPVRYELNCYMLFIRHEWLSNELNTFVINCLISYIFKGSEACHTSGMSVIRLSFDLLADVQLVLLYIRASYIRMCRFFSYRI